VKIKRRTERAVRKAFGAAVAGEADRLSAAVAEISGRGDEFDRQAWHLVFEVGSATLFSIHHGDRPTDQQLRLLAKDYVNHEAWAGIDEGTVRGYLKALADEIESNESLAVSNPMFAACVIGGWLLSAFIPDEVRWTDFLDGILAQLEG
jgi:hypothetical protein